MTTADLLCAARAVKPAAAALSTAEKKPSAGGHGPGFAGPRR